MASAFRELAYTERWMPTFRERTLTRTTRRSLASHPEKLSDRNPAIAQVKEALEPVV